MRRWIRLHTDLPSNRKAQLLPAPLFKFWINCLALAGRSGDGELPPLQDIAWELREKLANVERWTAALIEARMLDCNSSKRPHVIKPHDWHERQFEVADSTPRVREFRNNRKGVTETVTVTHEEALQKRDETVTNCFSRARSESESVSGFVVSGKGSPEGKTIGDPEGLTADELDAAWERHLKHGKEEPKDTVFRIIFGMNGTFDVARFRERHGRYCESMARTGWQFSSLSFLGWVRAGMPEPPPKPERTTPDRIQRRREANILTKMLGEA